jgi:phosphoglycerate dehydrogenase-like enzyme
MAARPSVFIPEPFPSSSLTPLAGVADIRQGPTGRACDPDELLRGARLSDALVITSRDRITRDVIDGSPRLRIIAKSGAKPSNVDFDAAAERGVLVTWTPGANSVSVAEYTVGLFLVLAKRIIAYRDHLAAGGWRRYDMLGGELDGKTAGLIGFGAIGRQVARRLRALGMRVVAHDPAVPAEAMRKDGVQGLPLDRIFAEADYLSLHCELNDSTRGLIGQSAFAAMKPTAFIVNTARGGLIDEDALARALEARRIAGAAIDVFAVEPLLPESPLLSLPNVIATPHVAAFSAEAIRRETQWALEDVAAVLTGGAPIHWNAARQDRG